MMIVPRFDPTSLEPQFSAEGLPLICDDGQACCGPCWLPVTVTAQAPAVQTGPSSFSQPSPGPIRVRFAVTSPGNVVGWAWNFGDGTTGSGQNPSHSYALPGGYLANVVATLADGTICTGSVLVGIDIYGNCDYCFPQFVSQLAYFGIARVDYVQDPRLPTGECRVPIEDAAGSWTAASTFGCSWSGTYVLGQCRACGSPLREIRLALGASLTQRNPNSGAPAEVWITATVRVGPAINTNDSCVGWRGTVGTYEKLLGTFPSRDRPGVAQATNCRSTHVLTKISQTSPNYPAILPATIDVTL